MRQPKGPCLDCPDREPGCHGRCERYAEYRSQLEAYKDKKQQETLSTCTENAILRRILRRKWSDKRKR